MWTSPPRERRRGVSGRRCRRGWSRCSSKPSTPSCSTPHQEHVARTNASPNALQRDSDRTRNPAAAHELAVDGTGHPRLGHPHRSTRGSKGSQTSPSTASPVPCSAIPHRAAVSGLAGVMSPVGLTCLTWGLTPPGSLMRGPRRPGGQISANHRLINPPNTDSGPQRH